MRVFAALACGSSVALAAYASHGAQGQAQQRLVIATLFAFSHGLALLALPARTGVMTLTARVAFVVGILLFSGSLVMAAFFGTPTLLAPAGGSLLILGWCLLVMDYLRQP